MTKTEMIKEMIEGVEFDNNERVIKNRIQSPKKIIEIVYNCYLNSNKTKEDKIFYINLLVKW